MSPEIASVGQCLKTEREKRDFSREYIARSTRIKPAFIEAMEENHFDALPAETYAKGFIRCYCKFLGLNPEEMLDMYRRQVEPPSPETPEKQGKAFPAHSIKNHLFDFLATIVGGAPAYSVHKSYLRPK
ncbi:MAG TPA: helix-turn-helix transcriptional regulator [Thermodesulfobacteriota bacterium]|nr:helix-turn-helix transcriptional regulator [Thermodesulfobacteriota bacterium]